MVTAILLMNVERPRINAIAEDLATRKGVSEVYSVSGNYDLVALLRVETNEEMASLVTEELAGVEGIEHIRDAAAETERPARGNRRLQPIRRNPGTGTRPACRRRYALRGVLVTGVRVAVVHHREQARSHKKSHTPDRELIGVGKGQRPSPPSEPDVQFSRIRLSSQAFPHRDRRACAWAACRVNSPSSAK